MQRAANADFSHLAIAQCIGMALLVDPDPRECEGLAADFRENGFAVATSTDLAHAMGIVALLRPAYIVCEVRFPKADALTFIAHTIKCCPETRIIVHSRYLNVSLAVAVAKLGAFDVIPKPAPVRLLIKLLLGRGYGLGEDETFPNPNTLRHNQIEHVYAANVQNISATAKALGMHRRSLQRYLGRHPLGAGYTMRGRRQKSDGLGLIR
jgi:two-component system, response regulator RegA